MPRKPDRFERMVAKLRLEYIASPWAQQVPVEAWPSLDYRIVKLLRRQHRAYVKMIKDHNRSIQSFSDRDIQQAWKDGYEQACLEILNKLTEYKR